MNGTKGGSPVAADTPSAIQVMRRYLLINGKYTRILVFSVICSLCTSIAMGMMTQLIQSVSDNISANNGSFAAQAALLLALLIVLVPSQYLQQYLGIKYSELCDRNMRNKTYEIVSRIDMQALDAQRTGDLLSRANRDLGQINQSLQNYFAVLLPQEIMGVITLMVSLWINWQLTLFSLAIVPLFAYVQVKISSPLARFVQQRQEAAGESLSIANNLMGGYEVAKAYSMGETLQKRYDAAVDSAAHSDMNANRATILSVPFSQMLFFLPQMIICGFGVYLASINQITPGGIMAVLILSMSIRNPLGDFSSVLSRFKTARGCASRVFELWDMTKEPKGGAKTQPVSTSIGFSNVAFAYSPQTPILKGLSFEIHQGEHVALVGASGCGKSTVVKLLMALYHKDAGEINLLGHAIEDWSTEALRGYISYVGQDSYLFPGSIWDNVAMGNRDAGDAQIQAAIDAALLGDMDVHRHTGEHGMRLSGGQRQRVAIARAMLKDSPLLFLDEPTSALDTQSEALVSEALQHLMQGRTTIMIAHRLSALRNIDRILCMENGKIAESGTHEQLLALKGVYYRLYKTQEESSHESLV